MINNIKVGKYSFLYDEENNPLITNNNNLLLVLDDDYSNVLLKIVVSENEVEFIPTEHVDIQKFKIVALLGFQYKIISL